MNDSDLGTAVRESAAEVRSATPVDQIIGRGRGIRARRRIPRAAAAALTVAAGAALAVTTLQPSGQAGNRALPGWPRGQWPGKPTATSRSPSISSWTRTGCRPPCAPTGSPPP